MKDFPLVFYHMLALKCFVSYGNVGIRLTGRSFPRKLGGQF